MPTGQNNSFQLLSIRILRRKPYWGDCKICSKSVRVFEFTEVGVKKILQYLLLQIHWMKTSTVHGVFWMVHVLKTRKEENKTFFSETPIAIFFNLERNYFRNRTGPDKLLLWTKKFIFTGSGLGYTLCDAFQAINVRNWVTGYCFSASTTDAVHLPSHSDRASRMHKHKLELWYHQLLHPTL